MVVKISINTLVRYACTNGIVWPSYSDSQVGALALARSIHKLSIRSYETPFGVAIQVHVSYQIAFVHFSKPTLSRRLSCDSSLFSYNVGTTIYAVKLIPLSLLLRVNNVIDDPLRHSLDANRVLGQQIVLAD